MRPPFSSKSSLGVSCIVEDTSFHTFSLSSGLLCSSSASSSPTIGSLGKAERKTALTMAWDPKSAIVTGDLSGLVTVAAESMLPACRAVNIFCVSLLARITAAMAVVSSFLSRGIKLGQSDKIEISVFHEYFKFVKYLITSALSQGNPKHRDQLYRLMPYTIKFT
jgi:hypothetical protein